MKRRAVLRFLLVVIAVASTLDVSANGFRLADQDAFATARGEAFAATADNASAIYYNPAGITQLGGNNLRLGIYGIYFDPTFTPPPPNDNKTFHIKDKLAAVPQFFYTYTPENLPLSFGLGVYAPFGLGVTWPQDTGFRSVAIKGDVKYFRINPIVAIEVLPGLSVGGGLSANYGNIDLEQGLRATEFPFTNNFRFTGDGWSLGYNVGVLWKPLEQISIGGSFRSSTTITMDGHTEFQQQPVVNPTRLPARADFTFPLSAVVGISYRPTPKWNLEFDADYTDWSSFSKVTIRQQQPPPFPVQQNIPVTLNWQASWMYEFGVTRYFDNGWHVSAGYVFNENSVPNDHYSPLAADLDRHFISIGTGLKAKWFNFDLAYQFGYGPDHTVTGSTPSSQPGQFAGQSADGTYDFISHAVIVTVGVNF